MKTCKQCGFTGEYGLFVVMRNTCLKCERENVRKKEAAMTEEEREKYRIKNQVRTKSVPTAEEIEMKKAKAREYAKKYRKNNKSSISKINHKYYSAHTAESLERCRRNRAKKKLSACKEEATMLLLPDLRE